MLLNNSFENLAEKVEPYFIDLKYDGIYRVWPFLNTQLVVDQPSSPLLVGIHTLTFYINRGIVFCFYL